MSVLSAWMLDVATIVIIALFVFIGIKRGFIRELASTAGWIVSLIVAYFVSPAFASMLGAEAEADSELTLLILRVVAFVILYILCKIVLKLISKIITALVKKVPIVGAINTLLGGVLGAVEGAVFMLVLSMVLSLYSLSTKAVVPVDDTFVFHYFWGML